MNSDRPRPVTPYAPFAEPPRSITPTAVPAVTPPPSARPSEFPKAIQEALDLIEQSVIENVQRALRSLGTALLAKQAEIEARISKRFTAHATELKTIRGALERTGTILPPPPDGL
jgi:hypothetical protein